MQELCRASGLRTLWSLPIRSPEGDEFLGLLGVSFESYGDGWAEAAWAPTELACNPFGSVHGGVYGVIHDAAMNFAANSALEYVMVSSRNCAKTPPIPDAFSPS